MSRLLIYLSFLSLPGAEELGLLSLTFAYLAWALASPLLVVLLRASTGRTVDSIGTGGTLIYLCLLAAYLPVNLAVSQFNGVDELTWLSRSAHLIVLPSIYLCFSLERARADVLLRDIALVGAIETGLVFIAALLFQDADIVEFRRATDIEGVIVYSLFMVYAAFHALQRFDRTRAPVWLLAYLLVLLAAALTGTRVLLLAIAALLLALKSRMRSILVLLAMAGIGAALAEAGLFDRFNLAQDDNLITILSKVEELRWLGSFFLQNPLLGVGFGKAYQVSLASSEYTYSHNMVMFYLGYSGLVGLTLALWPLLRLAFVPETWVLVLAILVFYTSATTYTNVKHSLFLATTLLWVWQTRADKARRRALPACRAVQSAPPTTPRSAHDAL
jgi:hypothetical protein